LKHAEEELLKVWDELKLKVQDRTAELQNTKEELECTNEELRLQIEEYVQTEKALLKPRMHQKRQPAKSIIPGQHEP
jgi:hypothetical protein